MLPVTLNEYAKDDLSFSHCLRRTRTNPRYNVTLVESGIRITDNKHFDVCLTTGFNYNEGAPVFVYRMLSENIDYSKRPEINAWLDRAKEKFESGYI
jgi:hypothetical protein